MATWAREAAGDGAMGVGSDLGRKVMWVVVGDRTLIRTSTSDEFASG